MKHLGNITKISGFDAPLVDFVVGGSPCQDLSVAGARKGLLHSDLGDEETTRSGLFIEQIRIIREMRDAYKRRKGNSINGANDDIRCVRYGMWENVYGAFSSNHGADFRVCLEEFARVSEQGVSIPMPKDGKWKSAGAIIGNGWSIAWRTMDAQYWGVPQRRRRICLLADFDGYSAPDIVFESVECGRGTVSTCGEPSVGYLGTESESEVQPISEGLPRNPESCGEKRQETTTDAEGSIGASNHAFTLQDREGKHGGGKGALITEDVASCFRTNNYQTIFKPVWADIYNLKETGDVVCTLTSGGYGSTGTSPKVIQPVEDFMNPPEEPIVLENTQEHGTISNNGICPTLTARMGTGGNNVPMITQAYSIENHPQDSRVNINADGIVQTLSSRMGTGGGNVPLIMTYRKKTHPKKGGFQEWEEAYKSDTLNTFDNSENRTPTVVASMDEKDVSYCIGNGQFNDAMCPSKELSKTLNCMEDTMKICIVKAKAVDCRNGLEEDTSGALQSSADHNINSNNVGRVNYIVRRLTPMECERLQGFPDNWTNIGEWVDSKGKTHKDADAPRYKALGNSIALHSWAWCIRRMCKYLPDGATMASLFDGIGGFPLIWESINGKGTCLWASEIEEFPIAVTKKHFGEEDEINTTE